MDEIERNWPNAIRELHLPSLSEAHCIAAIEGIADFIIVRSPDTSPYGMYPDDALWVRIVLPDRKIYEHEFYEHVRLNCPGAAPALRNLVEKFAANWDTDLASASIAAAYAIAWLDQSSLPTVCRLFTICAATHGANFSDEDVDALVERHGWSPSMIEFGIIWFENTGYLLEDRWIIGGMRDAVKASMGPEQFAQYYHDVWKAYYPDRELHGFIGSHALDSCWIEYFNGHVRDEGDAEVTKFLPRDEQKNFDASIRKIADDASWKDVARRKSLSDWDRRVFLEFDRIYTASAVKGR